VLQCVAVYEDVTCEEGCKTRRVLRSCVGHFRCVLASCSVMQCVAACCSVLQCVGISHRKKGTRRAGCYVSPLATFGVLQGVAGCCRVLQGVAGCCRVLQGVAGCCRVLRFIAACEEIT